MRDQLAVIALRDELGSGPLAAVVEIRLVLQGRAEVAHGHGSGLSQRVGPTTLAVALSLFRVFSLWSNDSGPLFPELFCCCAFHLPTRPTAPFDLRCRQALIGERFLLIVRGAKPDGASRTSVHFDFPTSINLVAQAEPMVVVLDTKTNRSVFQLSLNCIFGPGCFSWP